MNKSQWYIEDRLGSLVRCSSRQEAEGVVADNIARYPSTGPWRAVQMVEVDGEGLDAGASPARTIFRSAPCKGFSRASAAAGVNMDTLNQAFMQAGLSGPLGDALDSPALATCLRNIVYANLAGRVDSRFYLSTDGQDMFVTVAPSGPNSPTPFQPAGPDFKSRAAGDC